MEHCTHNSSASKVIPGYLTVCFLTLEGCHGEIMSTSLTILCFSVVIPHTRLILVPTSVWLQGVQKKRLWHFFKKNKGVGEARGEKQKQEDRKAKVSASYSQQLPGSTDASPQRCPPSMVAGSSGSGTDSGVRAHWRSTNIGADT